MMFGLETVALSKRQEAELEVAEFKMLRFSLGVTRMDRIRNESIRGTVQVERLGDKVRGGTVDILDRGCWRWSCQVGGKE